MKFPKSLILATAALSAAGAIGIAYSQTSSETAPQPPATSAPAIDARPSDTTLPGNQESLPQSTAPQSSQPATDTSSTAASSDNTSTTPGDSAAMGTEQVARADRH
jgi:hypothetical protein